MSELLARQPLPCQYKLTVRSDVRRPSEAVTISETTVFPRVSRDCVEKVLPVVALIENTLRLKGLVFM